MLALFLFALVISAAAINEHERSCIEAGFSPQLVSCTDCGSLEEYVRDEQIVAECKKCCVKSAAEQTLKFTSAFLEVCPYRLNGLPQIKDFIDKRSKKYTSLEVNFKYGAYPRLILSGSEGTDTVRIDNWRKESIEEYLQDKLQ